MAILAGIAKSVKDEVTESILRRLKGWRIHLYMPNPLIEPACLNINTKLNIFSLERIPNKDEISGSSSERSNTKYIYKYVPGGYQCRSNSNIFYSDADIFIQKLWTMAYDRRTISEFGEVSDS